LFTSLLGICVSGPRRAAARLYNFPLALACESADSGGCPFLGTSFGQAKEVQNKLMKKNKY
jgi:hypothetical protein